MMEVKNKGGRPANPKTDGDLQNLLKGYAKNDIPAFRKRLKDIALGLVKEEQYDPKTGKLIQKAVPLSVSVDAINSYGKNILSKIIGDVKADPDAGKEKASTTDAIKAVEAKKRADLEAKALKEAEAKGKVVQMKKAQGEE